MSGRSKGPRLYLQPERRDSLGRIVEHPVWVIRDGRMKRSTGCRADDMVTAEIRLTDYIATRGEGERAQAYWVYFVTTDFPNFPIKIGLSTSPAARFLTLSTALPYPIQVLGKFSTQDPRDERRLHVRFAKDRLRGEWYRRSSALMQTIDRLTTTPTNPDSNYGTNRDL